MTNALRDLEFAGIDDPQRMGRNALPSGRLVGIPGAEIRRIDGKDVLAYNTVERVFGQEVESHGLLGEFMRIEEAEDVRRFAVKFGPLELCEDGLPFEKRYSWVNVPHDHNACNQWHHDALGQEHRAVEPIAPWLRLASAARARIALAALADHGVRNAVTPELLGTAFQPRWAKRVLVDLQSSEPVLLPGGPRVPAGAWQAIIRWYLGDAVNDLFHWWQVRPWYWWPDGVLVGMHTREFIPLQMASAFVSRSLAVCSGCHIAYQRAGRAAPAGRGNYCPRCKAEGIDNRARQRAHRERKTTTGGKP